MLWQPIFCRSSMIRESSVAVTSAPSPNWLVSKFWQKTQRRLHQPKKIVPDPFQPRRQSSSPKCGKALATRASRPLLHTPILLLNLSISQSRGQTLHERSDSTASAARCRRIPCSNALTYVGTKRFRDKTNRPAPVNSKGTPSPFGLRSNTCIATEGTYSSQHELPLARADACICFCDKLSQHGSENREGIEQRVASALA